MERPRNHTVREAAEQLGLSPKTIRDWIYTRRIEFLRIGGRAVRISQAEIDRLLDEGRVPARRSR
jgi:excisionase family DNA binding protein